jgi:hypothetical protein
MLAILFRLFDLIAPEDCTIISLFNLLILSIPCEVHTRSVSCAELDGFGF